MNCTQEVAKFINNLAFCQIDDELLETTKLCFMDWLAVIMVGSQENSTAPVLRLIKNCGGNRQASILGTQHKTSLLWAAMANGTSAQALDFDDIYAKGPGHFTGPVISATYPLCEWKQLDGITLLRSIIAGVQVMGAVNAAVMPDHYKRGWHNTGTMGHFGATAASSMALGLNEKQICYALGIAASQVASVQASFGTMTKPFHGGKAAMNGLLGSLLASDGFTASTDILDKGFFELFSATVSHERLLDTLNGKPVINDLRFKRFACGVATHPAIMSSLRIRETESFEPKEIAKITLKVYPRAFQCASIARPVTGLQGKFSAQYCTAAALIRGKFGLEEFEDSAVNDPKVQALLPKISMESVPSYQDTRSSTVIIELTDGRRFEDTTNPFVEVGDRKKVRKDVVTKFHSLAESFISSKDAKRLEDLIMNLDGLSNVGIIADMLSKFLASNII